MNLKINGKKCNRSAWRTTETFLHLDQSNNHTLFIHTHKLTSFFFTDPLLDPEFCRVQGILNLKDNKLDDGGFQGVPGSHKQFKEWGTKHKSSIPPTSHLVTYEKFVLSTARNTHIAQNTFRWYSAKAYSKDTAESWLVTDLGLARVTRTCHYIILAQN